MKLLILISLLFLSCAIIFDMRPNVATQACAAVCYLASGQSIMAAIIIRQNG